MTRRTDDEMNPYERMHPLTRRQLLKSAAGTAVGMSVLGLAACGGGEEAAEEEQPAGQPRRGGVMQLAISDTAGPKESLDPAIQTNANDAIYTSLIYENLTASNEKWEISPVLAESWKPNRDASEWTFKLRQGVSWHDGKPFTSKDAAFSIGRLLEEKLGSGIQARLAESVDKGGISTPDDNTLVLKLKRSDSLIPLILAARHARIVQAGTTNFDKGIGTGPFRLRSFKPARSWQLDRNTKYWEKGLPYLDGVRGVIITEQSTKVQSVVSGQSHLTDTIDFTAAATVKANPNVKLRELKNGTYLLVAMDQTKPPFDDERVRMAIKLAVDRERVLNAAFQGYGTATSDVPVPQDDPFFPDEIGIRKQDLEQAKQLLADAGHSNGIDIELFTSQAYSGMVDLAVAFKEVVAPAGIRVKIRQWPAETFWDQVWLVKPMYTSYYTRRHPHEALSITYASKAPWNESKFKSKELDSLLARGLATADVEEQTQIYQDALAIVANEAGTSIPAFVNDLYLAKKSVEGIDLDLQNSFILRKAYLSS